jgi:hypothetical protein
MSINDLPVESLVCIFEYSYPSLAKHVCERWRKIAKRYIKTPANREYCLGRELAKNGYTDALKWCIGNGCGVSYRTYVGAACHSVEVLEFLGADRLKNFCELDLYFAKFGKFESIRWLYENEYPMHQKVLRSACCSGNIDTVEYLHSKGLKFTKKDIDCAVIYGRLELLKWLKENGHYISSPFHVRHAEENNHIAVSEWLKLNN